MNHHTETRKLAAVMFTDIEGYTTMFHKDESRAMEQIAHHRRNLEQVSHSHSGHIIQFYGDGSLVIFDSVIDAVRSATELQLISHEQDLPLRIGIHLGDLVVKDGDIFGDVVNHASRLQAIGVPGSIIVSKKVIEELDNHPEITYSRLGFYQLKNIEVPQELYAITGSGLAIPEKPLPLQKKTTPFWQVLAGILLFGALGWYLFKGLEAKKLQEDFTDERIAVPPFENFTTNADFNPVSQMAAHWITTELIELANANVVSYPSSAFYTNISEASMPIQTRLAKQTGAVNIIKGAFSFTGKNQDSLVFWANIINTKTGQPLPIEFAKVYCSTSDPLDCIKEMSNEIKGYWKSKDDKVLSPPNYNAYKAYLQARNTWDGLDDSIPESYLREAIRLDPKFLDAHFLLVDLFFNQRNYHEASDSIRSILVKFTELTSRQENYLKFLEEDINGRRVQAYSYYLKEYENDPRDIFVNTTAMVFAQNFLNDPDRVLKFYNEINIESLDLKTCPYCLERLLMALKAYMETGQKEKAQRIAEKVRAHAIKRDDYHRLMEWYIFNGDTVAANQIIDKIGQVDLDDDYRYLVFVAGRQAMLKGDISLRNYYADLAIKLYGDKPTRALARAYYLKGDLDNAEKNYDTLIVEDDDNKRLYAELGLIYARKGDQQKVEAMIKKLEELKEPFDYGETPYLQGRIKAVAGQTEDAIRLLNRSLDEGQRFISSVTFQGDPDLMGLWKEKGYEELLVRNRP